MEKLYQVIAVLTVPLPGAGGNNTTGALQTILNIVLGISGAIAVLIIVLAGFRYIISQGNPSEVATARNAILYALIGLVVIICAFAIVNFVVKGVS